MARMVHECAQCAGVGWSEAGGGWRVARCRSRSGGKLRKCDATHSQHHPAVVCAEGLYSHQQKERFISRSALEPNSLFRTRKCARVAGVGIAWLACELKAGKKANPGIEPGPVESESTVLTIRLIGRCCCPLLFLAMHTDVATLLRTRNRCNTTAIQNCAMTHSLSRF